MIVEHRADLADIIGSRLALCPVDIGARENLTDAPPCPELDLQELFDRFVVVDLLVITAIAPACVAISWQSSTE
jgi:hypothetical protein